MGHAANFLYMLTGERPNATAIRAFDVALTLHADHELNASTFAGRVAAATLTDIYSAVVAAIGTLKGPLHGGANAEVMKMLLELGETASGDRVDDFVRGKLARKEKIPGFGHRVYKTEDPRATHLRQMSSDLGKRAGNTAWFDMSQRIEALVKGEKKLNPNVDFYSASIYYTLGIPIDLYTPIFAVSRMSGWTAHILEQYANNRLIRPRADYTGPDVSAAIRSSRTALRTLFQAFPCEPDRPQVRALLRHQHEAIVRGELVPPHEIADAARVDVANTFVRDRLGAPVHRVRSKVGGIPRDGVDRLVRRRPRPREHAGLRA